MKKAFLAVVVLFGTWACVSFAPAPLAFYIEDLPSSVSARLTLDQRITADEAWRDLKEGRGDRARRQLAKLSETSPVYAVGMGFADLAQADQAAAEANFLASLNRYPDLVLANIGLAQIYQQQGRKDLELAQYREILKREPGHRWAAPRLDKLREELVGGALAEAKAAAAAGNREEAKKALSKVLAYAPDSGDAALELARIYRQEKNAGQAGLHYKAAVAARPADKAVLREYADFLYEAEELGQSLDHYEKLAELEPGDRAVAARIEELKNKLGVVELPSQYGLIAAQESLTREDLAALVAVKFKDFLNVPERQAPVMVDVSTSWARKFIVKVASLGVMNVYDNHTFQPRRIINRAELADAVVRLMDFLKGRGAKFVPLLDIRRVQIADVMPDSYYFPSIARAVACQVMDLSPQRMFEPGRIVSGRDALKILDIVLGLAR